LRRRDGDRCPVTGALQLIGDKWTMLVVRDLSSGPRRTTELLAALHPISSRTLVDRLRDMEQDDLIARRDFGGSPPRVEYVLTERGVRLLPLLDALRRVGEMLDCSTCEDRFQQVGSYCDSCPRLGGGDFERDQPLPAPRQHDDSIVLL
jgi:DNA-binding HxlR family transcriptional regulator